MTRGDANESVSRRGFMTAIAGGAAAAGTAATAAAADDETTTTTTNTTTSAGTTTTTTTTTTSSGPGEVDWGDWFKKTETFDGTVDKRGQTEVTIEVGPKDTEDPKHNFDPAAIRVDPGTKLTWKWKSNTHNIVVADQPKGAGWKGTKGGSGKFYDAGHSHSHTFDTEGVYAYYCVPHKSMGMKGGIVVGDGGGAVETGGKKTTTKKGGGGSSGGPTKTVKVGPGGNLVFEPADLKVTPGTTVKWVWESDTHNIVVSSQPDGANWNGTAGGAGKTYDTGHTYTHTFDTKGTYEYYCAPHRSAGMKGSIEVTEDAGGGGGARPTLPNSALTLGVATLAAMLSTLALAYFFLRYGGDYEPPAE